MPRRKLKPEGHFEKAPDVDGEFRVVTAHHWPATLILAPFWPLTEKWEQGTLSELRERAAQLKHHSENPIYTQPGDARAVEIMAEYAGHEHRALQRGIDGIIEMLDRRAAAEEFPVSELGDPVV